MLRRRGTSRRRGPVPGSGAGHAADRAADRTSGRDAGMVTAEVASALPALLLVVIAASWAVTVGLAQIRCADAAREAVRAAARGDDVAVVRELAEAVAPAGATVTITEQDGMVAVEVSAPIVAPVPFGERLPAPTVRATSYAVGEAP